MEQVIADRYQLGRLLGAGGMARVFQAEDRRLGRQVAIKLLDTSSADANARERFLREARTAAKLSNPNVVAVYDVGDDDGALYIVMELVEGPSLAEELRSRRPLDADEAVRIADQVLGALEAAHARGIIHRDVKPSNVLFDGERVKLADFGIATTTDELAATLTSTGQVVGTVRYLAPERVDGQPATAASDVYSVGVMLYEMLSGSPPFRGDSALATMLAHQRAPVPDLAERRPDLPRAITAVVERALAKRPEDRYPNADAMRRALRGGDVAQPSTLPTTVVTAPAQTMTLPHASARSAPRERRRHRGQTFAVVVALVAAAAVAALVAAVALDGDDPAAQDPTSSQTTVPTATSPPTSPPTAPPTAPPSTAPQVTTAQPTSNIAGFISSVSQRSGDLGEKLPDLLDKMGYVDEQTGEKRSEEVDKLVAELSKWAREGELDAAIANEAVSVLQANRSG